MPRTEARGDQRGGKLESGLDADLDRAIIAIAELVVADDRHEGAENLEGTVKIDAGFEGVGEPGLGIPPKLKTAAAVVALDIRSREVKIVHIQLLPDCPDASPDKGAEFDVSRPAQNAVDLNRNLNQFPVGRVVIRITVGEGHVVLVDAIISQAGLQSHTQPLVKIIAKLDIQSKTGLKGEIFTTHPRPAGIKSPSW